MKEKTAETGAENKPDDDSRAREYSRKTRNISEGVYADMWLKC